MTTRDTLATVIPLPVAAVARERKPASGDLSLDVDRVRLRRQVLAALLHHGADGIRGECYCGLHPRSLKMHMASAVAIETHLPHSHVAPIMERHRNAVGITDLVCDCGATYSPSGYGREQHLAQAIAADIPAAGVRRALTEIRTAERDR